MLRFCWVPFVLLAACSSGSDDGTVAGEDASTTSDTGGTPPSDSGATASDTGSTSPTDSGTPSGPPVTYGSKYEGGEFHLGPVDYDETKFHNACAPGTKYAPAVRAVEGTLLAGLWNGLPDVAGYCDACIWVTTAKGKSALLRVVTYGDTTSNSIDVSPDAYAILNSGEYPRSMTWQFAKCPATGKVMYEFQTMASEWWTSLWVRNARVPLTKVEVKSVNYPSFTELSRGTDGTLTDPSSIGFGHGAFTLRLTGMDGTQITDTFDWPASGVGGITLTGAGNFP